MRLNKYLLIFLLWGWSVPVIAQLKIDYFQFPIKPGERNYLSGNMSEIRPNHFHTGIDIKTDGRQGLPVYAVADGEVYRMKISSFGYGNVLYLKHTNGMYTLYGHLRDFNDRIADFMWEKMIEAEENNFEIYPEPNALPVKKGEIIAYSGNTGSSGGPHLHFEIRDSLDRAVDPLKYDFEEIEDSTPPTLTSIALSPLELDSRINGKFERTVIKANFRGNQYVVDQPIHITGKVGIEIRGYDKLDGAYNRNGFPHFEIYEDGEKTFDVNVDKVDFNLGRFLLSHTHQNSYTKLYTTAYNQFDYYSPKQLHSGAIEVNPDSIKNVLVKLEDVFGNTTDLNLQFKGEAPNYDIRYNSRSNKKVEFYHNWMILRTDKVEQNKLAKFYVDGLMLDVMLAYEDPRHRTYIWDMEYGVPDSVDVCTEMIYPGIQAKIPFNKEHFFSDGYTHIKFDKESLLESLFLSTERGSYNGRPSLKINHDRDEFLRDEIEVSMDVAEYSGEKAHVHAYQLYENGWKQFLGGQWEGDHFTFKTKKFGTFVLAEDNTPPSIRPIRVNTSSLRFVIGDDRSGIKDFEARIDGEWVIMRYEHKSNVIWAQQTSKKPFKGQFELKVTDNAGNSKVFSRKL
ncbi:M23 family metallopeptidase [Echinicola marina]|uniref:M23 family metallopeptidase n=1 Tax=Echinicola marina TaxID=2859768 RepID=UPI001CF6ED52|nr:M23 family metallopeptidase [Echinicola marina]UCS92758.1 M23 family metallopeptidase [Echinicola marina]